jgi:hypothetical protein
MADHDEFDASELASAYLDGEVSDDERARVESDAALVAEVERLRRVRAALGDVPSASAPSREAAIAAALSTFDEQHTTDAERPGERPSVVPLDRHRRARWMQGITAAAAVALIVVGGFAIANRDDDDDEATTAREQASEPIAQPPGGAALDAATSPAPAVPAAAPTTTVAAAVGDDTTSELEQAEVPMAAAVPATGPTANVLSEAATAQPVISDPGQLAEFAASLDPPPRPLDEVLADCGAGELAGKPDAAVITDGTNETGVVVARTPDGPVAVSLTDCSIVMRTSTGPTDTDS